MQKPRRVWGGGVRAGGLDHSQVVTEAVVDVNSAGKSHVGGLHHCWDGQKEGGEPGTGRQGSIGLRGHVHRVVQGPADSHVAVIGHDHQDEGFGAGEAVEEVHLQEAGGEAEDVVPKQEEGQHLGDGGCGEEDVQG